MQHDDQDDARHALELTASMVSLEEAGSEQGGLGEASVVVVIQCLGAPGCIWSLCVIV